MFQGSAPLHALVPLIHALWVRNMFLIGAGRRDGLIWRIGVVKLKPGTVLSYPGLLNRYPYFL